MSRFSGKCDLYDNFFMIQNCDLDYIKRCKIYIGYTYMDAENGNSVSLVPGEQLHIETMKDLVPYFAHVITMMYGDGDGQVIFLTEKSWPDIEREKLAEAGMEFKMYDFYKSELEKEMEKYGDEL